jgi:hypothetical protein
MKQLLDIFLFPFRCIMRFIDMTGIDYPELPKRPENPYELIWYRQGWSDKRVAKNNTKYWEWEMKYNNFQPQNIKKNDTGICNKRTSSKVKGNRI